MQVAHLSLTDFRNYSAVEVPFARGFNLFVGRNGQGKTNLIEAIGYLSTLGSHRVSSDQAMIRQGAESAIIRAQIQHGERQILAEVQLNRAAPNRAQINRSAIRARELPRYFASVLFAPEDLALVRGGPGRPEVVPRRIDVPSYPSLCRGDDGLRTGCETAKQPT